MLFIYCKKILKKITKPDLSATGSVMIDLFFIMDLL